MNMWTAIVVIVAIGAFVSIMRARYYAQHGIIMDRHGHVTPPVTDGRPDPELLREIESLRKRLEVLERITTDERHTRSIAAEIESLRDK
ncbi:MAG: hypothetical protein ABWZ75_08385 [Novosphingobium sp.]